METVLIVVHLIIVLAMAVVILLQRSEGGALGMGGGGGGGFMSSRGSGNLLTKTTAILATGFFLTSISLTIIGNFNTGSSILDRVPGAEDGGIQPISPLQPIAPAPTNVGPQVPTAE